MPTPPVPPPVHGVLLRAARDADDQDLLRLAALEGATPLPGPVLVAVEDGAIAAALCLSTGRAVADPFVPSQHLVELLRHRAGDTGTTATARSPRGLLPRLALRAVLGLNGAKHSW